MRPFITVEKQAQEALDFYSSVFPSFSLISLNHHAEPHHELVMSAIFSIKGQEIMISDSFVSHEWGISPGISFFLDLDDKDELDTLLKSLEEQGKIHMPSNDYGFSERFAWVEDKFGVNWQLNVE
jgi:predicted 3-demethylubiquinone-9 3-methyltransferase (glyoxalase superfamily)